MKQVDKDHYTFENYCYFDRWSSYFYQLREILDLKEISSILEVGSGDGVVRDYIRNNTQIGYSNVDIAEDLKPDIVGAINDLPVADNMYDAVCAFEVLEHLPFEQFEKSILEMKRVSKKYVLISIPHFGPAIKLNFKIPFLPEVNAAFKIPFLKKHVFNGQHYWEVGKKGYSPSKIRKILRSHFTLLKEFVPYENQYHHFYILEKS